MSGFFQDFSFSKSPNLSRVARLCAILTPVLVLLFYGVFLAHKINLVTADLGRHIKNGEMVLQNAKVLTTNFYSYTNPDFPVLNHHWGAGVMFFLLWKVFGFAGLQIFFIGLSMAALWLFWKVARDKAGSALAGLIAIPAVLLLAERTEIRPEAFSYFFAGLFLFLLTRFRDNEDKPRFVRFLYFLPLIEILWVNIHIYFILGPIIIGVFLIESLFRYRVRAKKLFSILILTCLATFLNPFGIHGVAEVFTIFNNFGYPLAENQSVWFLQKLFGATPNLVLFQIIFWVTAASFLAPIFAREWRRIEISSVLFTLGFGGMAWLATRNLALFGFFVLPVIASNLSSFACGLKEAEKRGLQIFATSALAVMVAVAMFGNLPKYFPYWRVGGLQLEEGNESAANFWKEQGLKGPIFNNYDIGGYLIYNLYPEEKVFTDNRPEAYPQGFFEQTYIPMQENPALWEKISKQYNFNAIVFSWHDGTPWGQKFLIDRVRDSEWAPVFVDDYVIIFLKRVDANSALIKKFAIPKERFGFSGQ